MSVRPHPERTDEETVLVVDDEGDVAETHTILLEERGFSTRFVTSATGVLDALDDHGEAIDAIVSDYQMPGLDGLELLAQIRNRYPTLPFILFTGRGSEEIASKAISEGVTDYIQKGGLEKYDLLANRLRNAIERASTHRELERAKARFDALTQNADYVVITVDSTGEIQYVSESVENVMGYEQEELLGEPLVTIIPDRLAGAHREKFQRYLRTGERTLGWGWIELSARHRDGTEVPVGISFGERENLESHFFTGIIRDITDRKRREQELKEQKRKFEAIYENALDSIFLLDPDSHTIVEANPRACEMLGYDRDELVGRDIEAIHPDDYQEVIAFATGVLEEGGKRGFETACYTKDGEAIPAEVVGSRLEIDGRVRVLAIVRPDDSVSKP